VLNTPTLVAADYVDDVGLGTVTVAANVFYVPTKLVYAGLGGITGSFADPLQIACSRSSLFRALIACRVLGVSRRFGLTLKACRFALRVNPDR